MDTPLFTKNFDKIQRPVTELVPFDNAVVIPITDDGYCPFLTNDYQCAIYDERPEVCRKFGDESHPQLFCEFQTKDGKERNKKDRRKISEIQLKAAKNFINK